ncbi:MAG: hypothetical protein GX590_00460 [Lentisphaerae bacterium]|nr:hypothetical protein [Lentisphaerota bacterium]
MKTRTGVLALACLALTAGCDTHARRQAAPDKQAFDPDDTGQEPTAAVQASTETDGSAPPLAACLSFDPPSVVDDLESLRAQDDEAERLEADLIQYASRQGTNHPFALTETRIQSLITRRRSALY